MSEDEKPRWRLERRVPLTLVVSLLAQIGILLIWATQLDARVATMEVQTPNVAAMNEKFARLEERLDGLKQNMDSVKRELDHLTDRLLKP